ncbi:AAA family ATPase [Kineococcus glutinatus]|uniref:AAA family ATPase n=1 Tax=Kineococcus glutinatus TaxID=1070872 RepID=UPI0031E5AADF
MVPLQSRVPEVAEGGAVGLIGHSDSDPWTAYTLAELLTRAERLPTFVVPNLLARGMNLYSGQPKAGKSCVAVNLVHAAVTGDEFLGAHRLVREDGTGVFRRVLVLSTEIGGDLEYGERLRDLGTPLDTTALQVLNLHEPLDRDRWAVLAHQIRADAETLVVLDNLTMAGEEDLTDEKSVRTVMDGLGRMVRSGATVVVVAHESDWGGAQKSRPLGHTVISSSVRCKVSIAKPHPDDDENLTLTSKGNRQRTHVTRLRRGACEAELTVVEETEAEELAEQRTARKRARDEGTKDRNREIAEAVVRDCQGMNQSQVAAHLAEKFALKVTTAATNLSRGAQYGALLVRDGSSWSLGAS